MDGTISIMQYNCGQANYRATRPLLDAVSPATHAVLAIQEPAYSKRTCTTYCPVGYNLAYEDNPKTRVCFMVSKQIHVSNWSHQAHGPYVATLCVQTSRGPLHIVNVYNPRGNGPRIRVWDSVQRVLDALPGKVVLLGDFNAHHPAWGGRHVAGEPQAEHLLLEMARRGLRLLTPEGETTWKRGRQESVIDLTFASADVQSTLHWCGPRDEWAVTQDHLPIDIRFEILLPPQPESRRLALGKLDVNGLAAYLKDTQW
jgi:exonuclease III